MKNRFVLNNEPKDLIRQNSDVNFQHDNTKPREMREMKSLNKHFEPKKKHFFFQQGQKVIGDYRFDPKKQIGNGYSSKVYKAISIKDKKEYAIKALELINFKPSQFQMLQNEIKILKKVSHPNIIRFYNVIKTKTHLYIVTEFCSKGDLLTYMTRKGILSQKEALEIFTDILKGMQYLFKLGIIHRDIKPGNILYDGKIWKIADFGFSLQSKEEIRTRNNVGTPLYMPIQSLQKNIYSAQSDIFSLGVLFYELLIGITPWQCRDEEQLMRKLRKVQFKIPQKFFITSPIKQLLTKLCQPLRQNRMNKKQFSLLNSIEIKRSSIEASLAKKSIIHQSQKQINSPSTARDLHKATFNLQPSLQKVPSSLKFKTQTNFFTTGKMKKSSQNNKIQTKQLISKIKSTSNLPPSQNVQHVNAEENYAGQSILISQNYQKVNKNILISMLNFCRFKFYLMKNAQYLELNQFNRVKIKMILIKHSMLLLKQLTDTKKNWFGLQEFETYLQTKSYYKLFSSFQDYLGKYERQYQHILRKVDEQTLRQVSQKLPQLMRDETHCSNQNFYKRLVSFIAPILRENNHNLALEILHKKKPIQQTKQKIQAIKNFLKYYNLIQKLSQQGGLYRLQANQIEVVKSYQGTKASVQQFMSLRKQMKYI